MIYYICVLHNVQAIAFSLALFVQLSLGDAPHNASLDPGDWVMFIHEIKHLFFIDFLFNMVKICCWKFNFYINSLNFNTSLFINEIRGIELLIILFTFENHSLNDFIHQVWHVNIFELLRVINSRFHESWSSHIKNVSNKKCEINKNLNFHKSSGRACHFVKLTSLSKAFSFISLLMNLSLSVVIPVMIDGT